MAKSVTTPGKSLDEDRHSLTEADAAHNRSGVSADEAGRKPCDCGQALVESMQHPKAAVRDIAEREWAEKALRESEQRFRSLVETTSDWVWEVDQNGIYTYASPRVKDLLGYEPEEVIGKTPFDFMPADEAERVAGLFRGVADSRKPFADLENTNLHKDGRRVVLETSGMPILDAGGNLLGYRGIDRDITERKRAEEAEREATEKLRVITNSAQDAIIMIDYEGAITFWNPSAEKIFGYPTSEAIGKDTLSLILPEDSVRAFREAFEQFKQAGTYNVDGKTITLVAKRKNAKHFPVEVSISVIETRDRWHAVAIARDITERHERERAFQSTVMQYLAMIDTVPAMIYLKDINHHYVVANEAFCNTVGRKLDDIVGKTDYDIFPREKADEYHKADKIVMDEDRRVIDHEQSIKDAGVETKWISTTRVPVHDSQGLVSGVVGLVQDVTEYHRSREQLVQADKLAAIGTLAAGVAHEINNPIGFISSNLNTMNKYLKRMNSYIERTGTEEDEDKEAILEILTDFVDAVDESTEGTTRVKNIVADLKSFSRVDRAEKERTNINEGIESTLNIVWNELKYHCKVEKDLGDIPDLYCIPNQLNQVLMNIFLNAGHATKGKSGLINIRTWADDSNICVSIKDNGVGIPRENLKKIFEPFFTTKDVGKGTGLGLSLAFDIIKKHGGNVEVKSEVGVGTEFIITLPREGLHDD